MELRKIDAARDIAATMARSANHVFLSADTLLLNVMDKSTTAPYVRAVAVGLGYFPLTCYGCLQH